MSKSFRTLNRIYHFTKTLETNLSKEYLNTNGSGWRVWEALRESLQNCLDEAQYMSEETGKSHLEFLNIKKNQKLNMVEIRDFGRGVDFEHIYYIGESGKRGTHYRGEKGEGEILSFLVAARNNIEKWMFSQNWAVTSRFETKGDFTVLVLDLYHTNMNIDGTVWRYEMTNEFMSAYSWRYEYMPELSKRAMNKEATEEYKRSEFQLKQYTKEKRKEESKIKARSTSSLKPIMGQRKDNSYLYVKGIYVKTIPALFSYNALNTPINRDRTMVDEFEIFEAIEEAWNSEYIRINHAVKFWKMATSESYAGDMLEYRKELNITNSDTLELLKKGFIKAFGKRSCIYTNNVASVDANSAGYKIVHLSPHVQSLALKVPGLLDDRKASGFTGDVKYKNPTVKEEKINALLLELGQALGFNNYDLGIIEKVIGSDITNLCGLFNRQKNEIKIVSRMYKKENRKQLIMTFIHEAGHGESGYGDAERGFVDWWENLLFESLTDNIDNKAIEIIKEIMEV